ncbi:RlpA-like double-psi beta-barrel domain-containing protein [Streptomyces sp. NPDC018693]|uniref:RlpA-like double-psi beta-barrel domain-containing protein n=1 Tax=unclassified Streptomyces TaxID=2593676 RepID=UPI0037AF6CDF
MKRGARRSLTAGVLSVVAVTATVLGTTPAAAWAPGTQHWGDATWYNPSAGVGACGWRNGDNEMVAAVSPQVYGNYPNPNNSPVCGRKMVVFSDAAGSWSKPAIVVTVVDRCAGCGPDDVDLSPAAFQKLRGLDVGRFRTTWIEAE